MYGTSERVYRSHEISSQIDVSMCTNSIVLPATPSSHARTCCGHELHACFIVLVLFYGKPVRKSVREASRRV